MKSSLIASLALLSEPELRKAIDNFTEEQITSFMWDWHSWARKEQLAPPGDWDAWVIDAGRGFGKTRAGAEWVRDQVYAGRSKRTEVAAD